MKRSLKKYDNGGKIKKPIFPGKLDNRIVSDNTSVQRPTIQQQDVRLKTPQEVKKANRENFQKRIGVKPTYNVQELTDFGTPEPGIEYLPVEAALLPGTPAIKGLGTVGNFALDMLNPLSGSRGLKGNTVSFNPTMPNVAKPILNPIEKNLVDLNYAKKIYEPLGYKFPNNIDRIAKSNVLTDRTIRGIVNRDNSFVRGVSTNFEHLAEKNPEILRHLEGKGIDWQNNPKAAAEYMATHIPIQTGYGRVGLNKSIFNRGMDGLYTSNSIPTAEGYTYGDGFITKVKRPTDFSSTDRKDWIDKNQFSTINDYLELGSKEELKRLPKNQKIIYGSNKNPEKFIKKIKDDIKGVEYFTIKDNPTNIFKSEKKSLYDYKQPYADWSPPIFETKDEILNYINEQRKYYSDNPINTILRTEKSVNTNPNSYGFKKNVENYFNNKKGGREFSNKLDNYLQEETNNYDSKINSLGESLTKYSWEQQQPIRDEIDKLINLKNKNIGDRSIDYMQTNHPDFDPINQYAHYIHVGTPGQKILDVVSSKQITPDIWKNTSRGHSNVYSKGLSKRELGGIITKEQPQYPTGGTVNTLEGDLISKVIMNRNRDKNFVNRAYAVGQNPNMFTLQDPENFGNVMSHKMAYGEDDAGQSYMYPTIMNPNNEAIKVPNQYADYISSDGYKKETNMEYGKGGYTVKRSSDRKGKTHVVIGPDGTKKYFGDPNLGERGKSKYGKEAFYARHKKNLDANPYFKAYARATWEEGGTTPKFNYNNSEINQVTGIPTGKGGLEDASLDVLQAVTLPFAAANLYKAGKIGYDAYQLAKPGVINLSKTYAPTYGKALLQAGKALSPFEYGGMIPEQGHISMNKRSLFKYGGLTVTDLNKYSPGGVAGAAGKTAISPSPTGANVGMGVGIASAAMPMIEELLPDKTYTDSEGNNLGSRKSVGESALSSAASGASMGMVAGPWGAAAGAVLGGAYGAIKGFSEKEKMDKLQDEAETRITNKNINKRANASYNWGTPNINTSQNFMFARGGMVLDYDDPNGNAELELQETFQMPDGTVGNVDGPSHENGGIAVDLPEGTRIWSDKLKYNGKTFAKHTKPITNTIAKLEKQIEKNPVNSDAKENSIALLKNQLDYYFDTQETNKQNTEMKRTLREGGIHIKPENRGKFTAYAESHGKGVQEMAAHIMANKEDYSPAVVKRANFAKNAAGWKHEMGGLIQYQMAGEVGNPYDPFNQPNEYASWADQNKPIVSNTLAEVKPFTPRVTADQINKTAGMNVVTPVDQVVPQLGSSANPYEVEEEPNVGFFNKAGQFIQNNSSAIGQLAPGLISAGVQSNRINRLARPKTLNDVRYSDTVANPNLVDYSAERNAIDRTALSAMDQAQRGFGSSAAAQAFKNKARLNQLEGTGRSFQGQENANAQIKNQFLAARQEAAMREAAANNDISKYNLENIYGFDKMKTESLNDITQYLGDVGSDYFGKEAGVDNRMRQLEMLAKSNYKGANRKTLDDLYKTGNLTAEKYKELTGVDPQKRNGGIIEYAEGGKVSPYKRTLNKVVNFDTNKAAQMMDAEYAAAMAANQDKYTSSITGLDYKVLPKAEKRALVTDMWREAHGEAPTQKQIESGVKAIEGKKVSSPKAKTMAEIVSSRWKTGTATPEQMAAQMTPEEQEKYFLGVKDWGQFGKEQLAQGIDAVGSLGMSAIGNPLKSMFGTDLGFGSTDMSPEAVNAKVSNPNEYADATSNALLGIMGGKALNMAANKIIPKFYKPAAKYYNAEARNLELENAKKVYKANQANKNQRAKAKYYEQVPEPDMKRYVKNIAAQEDEAFALEFNNRQNTNANKKIESKLNIAEGADRYPKTSLEKMNAKLDQMEIPSAKEIASQNKYSENRQLVDTRLVEIAKQKIGNAKTTAEKNKAVKEYLDLMDEVSGEIAPKKRTLKKKK